MLDERDTEILAERTARFNARPGPRVGDFVIMPSGDMSRFTHDWGKDIQTGGMDGRFYFDRSGALDYSGGLDPAIPKSKLRQRDDFRDGSAWFFHHDMRRAHNGVDVTVRCRVYEYRPEAANV